MSRAATLCLLAGAFACDGPAVSIDAGPADAGGPFTAPDAPAPPAPPCPDEWPGCAPPSLAACPDGEVRAAEGCRAFSSCPAGEWSAPPADATSVLYVRAGAAGGDGTEDRPLGSIQDAVRRAASGSAVLVAAGVYDETLDLFAGVTVIGACPARTVLAPSGASQSAVRMSELGTGLASLTVAPAAPMVGVEVRSPGSTLRSVIVEGARGSGVAVLSGDLVATGLAVRGTTDIDGELGFGVAVERAQATVSDVWAEANQGAGLVASQDATLGVERAHLRDNGVEPNDAQLVVQDGARLEIRAAVIGDGISGAGFAIGAGAELVVRDSWIGALRADPTGTSGAFTTVEGARLELQRVRITDTTGYAVGVVGMAGEGTSAQLEDVAIGPVGRGSNGDATGLAVAHADVVVRRVHIEDAASVGVLAGGVGELDVEDLRITGVGDGSTGGLGSVGIGLGNGVVARAERVELGDIERAGLLVSGEAASVTLTDVYVHDLRPTADGTFGRAIEIQGEAGIERALIERSLETAILAIGGGRVRLSDVRVLDSRARACAETSCPDSPGGTALAAIGIAEIEASRFSIEGARLCGAQVAEGASLDLRDGAIGGATVGACVQVAGYDLERVTDGVVYRDNGVNVDSTDHALPEASAPLPSF